MSRTSEIKRRIKPARVLAAAVCFLFLILLLVLLICYICGLFRRGGEENSANDLPVALQTQSTTEATTTTTTTTTLYPPVAQTETKTIAITDETILYARNATLIDAQNHTIIAERGSDEIIYPASMTKIMTMLTVLELLGDDENALYRAYEMDGELVRELRALTLVCAGFQDGEPCRIIDMLYGLMLPSGADAAVGLAIYTAGSEEAFVKEMNRMAEKMGLKQTHFTNCTGLHDVDHYSTANEIACILAYAIQNPLCRELMSTPEYITAATTAHPEGLQLLSTVFARLPETLPEDITIGGGKTGFTNAAGQCLATWAMDENGQEYICIVAGCDGLKPMDAVYDTLTLYDQYLDGDDIGAVRFENPDESMKNGEAA